jgi:glycerol-3-phosphate dehydrogenase subunit B
MTTDVLVLGGGMAGACAALAAAAAGARTVLVRAGPGATALTAGAWYSAPPEPVAAALARAGLGLEQGGALPHPDGRVVEAAFAPASHAAAALRDDGRPTLVCAIAGLPSFHARALAALWADAAAVPATQLIPVVLHLADTPAGGWAPLSLAALLEREPHRLSESLGDAARRHDADRAIVPAVLGVQGHALVRDAVERATGVRVGEALGSAPSLPGWRLDHALLAALQHAAVRVITGRATAHAASGNRISQVTVGTEGGVVTLTTATIVLATGKFVGGGISAASGFRETALGLDVVLERFGRSFDHPGEALVLTDPVRTEPQPLLAAGVTTNAASQPVTASGDVVFGNVVVAGSVRAGVETATLGLGAAAADGWSAGARSAELARGTDA